MPSVRLYEGDFFALTKWMKSMDEWNAFLGTGISRYLYRHEKNSGMAMFT